MEKDNKEAFLVPLDSWESVWEGTWERENT